MELSFDAHLDQCVGGSVKKCCILRSHFGSSHFESVCFDVIVNRDCEMAWQSSFSAHQESLIRCRVGRVARGARSATLAVCILWLHPRESQNVWSIRTAEGSWRHRSVENVSNPGSGNSTTVTTDGTKQTGDTCGQRASLSACIKTLENTLAALPGVDHSNLLVCTCKRRFRKRRQRLSSPNRWQCA